MNGMLVLETVAKIEVPVLVSKLLSHLIECSFDTRGFLFGEWGATVCARAGTPGFATTASSPERAGPDDGAIGGTIVGRQSFGIREG